MRQGLTWGGWRAGRGRLLGIALLAAFAARAPKAAEPSREAALQIDQNLATARWMLEYDRAAWSSTDLLIKEDKVALRQVSPVWFCLKQNGTWYAVYGANSPHGYEIAFCYGEDAGGRFHKVSPPEFPDKDPFGKAIALTLPPILETTRRTTVRFNDYVRREGNRIAVYYTPALQSDGKLAYGMQRTAWVDAGGAKLLSEDAHGQVLIGIIPGRQRNLTLEMTDCAVPTPQAIFTMLAYRDLFADIAVHCQPGTFAVTEHNGAFVCGLKP